MKKNTSGPPTTTNSRPLFILIGPTAVGKSSCALEIAEKIKGEIISADSMQVYRHLNIGTAKPTAAERSRIPHHLIDIVDPDEEWSVAEFTRHAAEAIAASEGRHRIPIICGGTGLYIRSLLGGYEFPPRDPSGAIRAALQKEAEALGSEVLHERLTGIDPVSGKRISPKDARRIVRALEVYQLTGRPISSFGGSPGGQDKVVLIGLDRDRPDLYQRINARVTQMITDGLIDEVASLLKKGYLPTLRSLQALGYKETIHFLNGHGTQEELEAEIQQKTRNFAKRQMTWWRSFNGINWFFPADTGGTCSDVVTFCCNKLAI